MTIENNKPSSGRMNLLTGSGLFFFLILYFDLRSDFEMTVIDWAVIIAPALVFIYALIQKIKQKQRGKQ